MKLRTLWFIGLFLLILSVVWFLCWLWGDFDDKPYYAMLQSTEYRFRRERGNDPIKVKDAAEGVTLLGLPSSDASYSYQWIILEKVSANGDVFAVPGNIDVVVKCSFVESLVYMENMNPKVVVFLKYKCR